MAGSYGLKQLYEAGKVKKWLEKELIDLYMTASDVKSLEEKMREKREHDDFLDAVSPHTFIPRCKNKLAELPKPESMLERLAYCTGYRFGRNIPQEVKAEIYPESNK